jgi:hypothetical protein
MAEHSHHQQHSGERGGTRAGRWVYVGSILIAAYFLWTEDTVKEAR